MALKSKLINLTNPLFIILLFSSCADVGGLVELAVKENINNTVKLPLKERGKVSPSIQPEILNNDIVTPAGEKMVPIPSFSANVGGDFTESLYKGG